MPLNSAPTKATRRRITTAQKLALRERRTQKPLDNNLELQQWFQATFNQPISTSSVSDILRTRFKHLDNPATYPRALQAARRPSEKWPELEAILYAWCQRAESQITISSEILKVKARDFWQQLPQYRDQPMPTFSNGWVARFQKRHNVKSRVQFGELSTVNTVDAEQEMVAIRQVLSKYAPEDIYNCDETGLLWKLVPDRSLSTRALPGRKKEKARITAHFTCNQTGTDKLPIWFIGTAKRPHCFRHAGIDPDHMGIKWYSNKKAWMTGYIFDAYLRWFDRRMAGRKVVLMMDNFSAHESAYRGTIESPSPLQNTLVIWLPANSTARFQPLDQGIIRCWKAYWKRQWLRYMLNEFEEGRNPLNTMDVLKAVRWGIQAWELDVSPTTISKCFKKGLQDPGAEAEPSIELTEALNDITNGLKQLQTQDHVREVMNINNFLNPPEEEVIDPIEDIDERLLIEFTAEGSEEEEDDDIDVMALDPVPKITPSEALEALRQLRLYQEQSGGDTSLITILNRQERALTASAISHLLQKDIRAYFK